MTWIDRTKQELEENIKRTPEIRKENEELLRELYEEIRHHGELEKTEQLIYNQVFRVYVRTSRGRRFVLTCEYPGKIEICELASKYLLEAPEESLGSFYDADIFSDLRDIVISTNIKSSVRKYEDNVRKIRDRLGRI